jgi:hypothetical protein
MGSRRSRWGLGRRRAEGDDLEREKKKLLKILLGGRAWGGRGSELGELN